MSNLSDVLITPEQTVQTGAWVTVGNPSISGLSTFDFDNLNGAYDVLELIWNFSPVGTTTRTVNFYINDELTDSNYRCSITESDAVANGVYTEIFEPRLTGDVRPFGFASITSAGSM